MAVVLGLDCKAYRNTATWAAPSWSEATNIRDVTTNLEKATTDVTTRGGSGYRQVAGTLKEGSVEFEMVWDTSDTNFTAIQEAFFGNTTVEMAFMSGAITTSGSEGLHADFDVTNFSRNEGLEDAVTVNVTLRIAYSDNAPEWKEVT